MNRKILFKAKRKDWEDLPKDQWWVEGDLLHTRYDDIVLISNFEDQLFRCDGNTVCQFTGLHDNTKWGDLTEAEKESFLSDWNYREDRKIKLKIGVDGRFGRMIFLDIAMTMMEVRF